MNQNVLHNFTKRRLIYGKVFTFKQRLNGRIGDMKKWVHSLKLLVHLMRTAHMVKYVSSNGASLFYLNQHRFDYQVLVKGPTCKSLCGLCECTGI